MTTIEWTDETWNPTDGCSVCSPGCANCYAMRFAGRFSKPGERYHGLVTIGKNKRAVWTGVLRLDSGKLAKPLRWKKPRKIFVNSMSDLFHENLTNEQIAAVFGVMAACPQHTFQVLTKRAKRMREWFKWLEESVEESAMEWAGRDCGTRVDDARRDCLLEYLDETACAGLAGNFDCCHLGLTTSTSIRWPLPNVWLGVSVENQDAADERVPDLLSTPAVVRGLSCEPLIGPVDLTLHGSRITGWDEDWKYDTLRGREWASPHSEVEDGSSKLDWVIAGCESGPGARPTEVRWLRALRDQCAAAGVPFFLKQAVAVGDGIVALDNSPPEIVRAVSPFDRTRFTDTVIAGPGSKRKAGGVIGLPYLDGKQHAEFPKC